MGAMLNPDIYAKVRLKPDELDSIVKIFADMFGPQDHLWVFGSRVDLQARGGDIDLYIETPETNADKIHALREKFVIALWHAIGEQRIDVVVKSLNDNFEIPIYNVAKKTGVKLR